MWREFFLHFCLSSFSCERPWLLWSFYVYSWVWENAICWLLVGHREHFAKFRETNHRLGEKRGFLIFSTAHNVPNMGRGREKIPTQNLLFAPPFMGTLKVEENSTVRKLHRHRSPEFCAARKKHPRIAWVDCSRGLRNHKSPKTTHVPHNDENYYVDMSNLNKCGVDLSIDRLTDGLMAWWSDKNKLFVAICPPVDYLGQPVISSNSHILVLEKAKKAPSFVLRPLPRN